MTLMSARRRKRTTTDYMANGKSDYAICAVVGQPVDKEFSSEGLCVA